MITSVQRMRVSFLSFQIKASENADLCRAFRCFDPRGGSAKRRAAPAFEILMLAPFRRFFPEPRQRLNGGWRRARVCTPPRISPSCPHYVPLWLDRCTIIGWQGHRKTACQSCFWMDGYRSSPSWAVFIQKICTGGLRASSASLFLFRLIRLMSFSRWICTFQAARGGLKTSPHY